jgi:hypothetical protein
VQGYRSPGGRQGLPDYYYNLKKVMKYNYSNNKPQPTKYIYRGYVMVTTFGLDPDKNEAFEDNIDFDLPNLIESREAGIKWYVDTLKGIKNLEHAWKISKTVCQRMNWNLDMFSYDVKIKVE